MGVLSTQNLTLAYDAGVQIITGLNVTIPSGRITSLVGRNGCGKSTLLRALARLLKPAGGGVYLDGRAISQLSTREVAKELGILPQGPVAPEGLTVQELVAQGRYPHQSWFQQWTEEDERKVAEALSATGMQSLASRPLEALSGGQRQRAWIAMALAQDTRVLLLDEPTTYLDIAYQIEILDLLWDLNQRTGCTIIMVLHDLNQACRYSHHLVALHQGKIAAEGDPVKIVTEGLVRHVFGIECRVVPDPVTDTPMCVPACRLARSPVALVKTP